MDKKPAYEAVEIRPDRTRGWGVVIDSETDAEALEIAASYAFRWSTPFDLYRVPFARDGDPPFDERDMQFVKRVTPGDYGPI